MFDKTRNKDVEQQKVQTPPLFDPSNCYHNKPAPQPKVHVRYFLIAKLLPHQTSPLGSNYILSFYLLKANL